MPEEKHVQIGLAQIEEEIKGMAPEEKWGYYAQNPGSQDIILASGMEKLEKSPPTSLDDAINLSGLRDEIDWVDQAQSSLGVGGYAEYLHKFPAALNIISKVSEIQNKYGFGDGTTVLLTKEIPMGREPEEVDKVLNQIEQHKILTKSYEEMDSSALSAELKRLNSLDMTDYFKSEPQRHAIEGVLVEKYKFSAQDLAKLK